MCATRRREQKTEEEDSGGDDEEQYIDEEHIDEEQDSEEPVKRNSAARIDRVTLLTGAAGLGVGFVLGSVWRDASCDDSSVAYNPFRAYRVLKEIQMSPLLAMLSPSTSGSAGAAATAILGTMGAAAGVAYRGELGDRLKTALDEAGTRPVQGKGSGERRREKTKALREQTPLSTPVKLRRRDECRIVELSEENSEPERTPNPRGVGMIMKRQMRSQRTPSKYLSIYSHPREPRIPALPECEYMYETPTRVHKEGTIGRYRTMKLPIRDVGRQLIYP